MMVSLAVICLSAGSAASAPVVTPSDPVTDLDDIGLYRIGYVMRGQAEQGLPVGWTGPSDDTTGVTYMPQGVLDGRRALLLHPPWRKGPGVTFQEFTLKLPRCRRIMLRGATAVRAEAIDEPDGVTFRVICEGRKLLDVHRKDARWSDFEFDLTESAGKTVTLRFETDPGPDDNTAWDHALWGGRQLVLEGVESQPAVRHAAPPPLDLRRVQKPPSQSVVPVSGFASKQQTELTADTAVFRYTGPDGVLEYRWNKPDAADPLLGRIELTATTSGGGSVLPLACGSKITWAEPATFVSSAFERTPAGVTCFITYKVGDAEAAVRVAGRIEGKSLVLDISCDKPLISRLDAGGWNLLPIRKQIPIPYYSGQVFYVPSADLFAGGFLDWTCSNASRHENTAAVYSELTDHSRNLLKERAVFTAAWHLAETMPSIPNPPSPYIKQLSSRIVLDIWGGKYTDIAKKLEELWDYGIRDCAAIIHVWQRSGYDNALPAHIPAMESLGGDEGMKTLVATARKLGYLVALHENYVDYYPNFEHFDESYIALNPDGSRVLGWYNNGTKIQAFQIKPTAMLRLASTQSPEIHRRYGTNASYLDVNSAVPPWWHVDCRAGEPGAGVFRQFSDNFVKLWQYERDTHGGPILGEGNNHWYWSGYLDGAEAQFGSGWAWGQGLGAPLAVDFDLLRIHPLQLNHGMGYYVRWHEPLGYSSMPPMVTMDQYRMQEIAYAHAGFLGNTTWDHVPLAWLEYHLTTPVTSRSATARAVDIRYQVNGKWVDATAAAKANIWNRVRIRYDNGLEITANSDARPMAADGATLPQYGWLARGAGVTAYTALRDDVVVDYAETKDAVFANARRASDWDYAKVWDILPTAGNFEQTSPRKFRLTYDWQVGEKPPEGYTCFVHFVSRDSRTGEEVICFQDDHKIPSSLWQVGRTVPDGPRDISVPEGIADGDYACWVGFYKPDWARLSIKGGDNAGRRVFLGTVHVSDGGNTITFAPQTLPDSRQREMLQRHLNLADKVIDFGDVRTNGSISIRREGGDWVLTPMPREKPFTIQLKASKFGSPKGVGKVGDWWRLKMNGAKEYRWKTK